jgi:hypothetical protein
MSSNIDQIMYWSQVVMNGLKDQKKLIDRAEPKVRDLSPDQFTELRDSGLKKVGRAIINKDILPLRELKTLEKAVLVKDLKNKSMLARVIF